jgi:hypothetical protein
VNALLLGNDQEIEFQEIEIHVFREIETFAKLIRRSRLAFFEKWFRTWKRP